MLAVKDYPSVVSTVTLFCKLCISSSFQVIYVHGSELFPTPIRNTGMGMVAVAAR